jgi:hypothetical protein
MIPKKPMYAPPKELTANKGASIERGKLLAKLRRLAATAKPPEGCRVMPFDQGYRMAIEEISDWVKESAARATKTPGGLGRK